jgi:cobyrinic acid a,c-diamide synthase
MQQLDGPHGMLTGHTFHYSQIDTPLAPVARATRPQAAHRTQAAQAAPSGEAVYRSGPIVATYMHCYWPSNPAFTAALFHGNAF